MRSAILKTFVFCIVSITCGCAVVPDLPDDYSMPVQDILHHAVCELRSGFIALSDKRYYPHFHANEWAMSITLTPKVDTELSNRLGATVKSTSVASVTRYISWTLGTSPGLELDFKGHRDGAVSFPIHSSQLLDVKHFPVAGCEGEGQGFAPLSQHLGIAEWLSRLSPRDDGTSKLTNFDRPSFNTEIIIKFDGGNAGPTWFVPTGQYSAALFGSVTRDEMLSIAFTPDPKKPHINTLPEGAPITKSMAGKPRFAVSPAALKRLDEIHTDEILQNLRVQPE